MKTKTMKKPRINHAANGALHRGKSSEAGPRFILPLLPYAFDALEPHIDALTMEIHYTKHHHTYVANLNKAILGTDAEYLSLEEICRGVSAFPAAVRQNAGGHFNHSMFWKIMSPEGGGYPQGPLAQEIDAVFGSFEGFKKQFAEAGMARFGAGWAWLSIVKGKLVVSSTPNQDNPLMDMADVRGIPILGMDVWEHAYYLRYQNRRAEYIAAFWNVINWKEVQKRYEAGKNIKQEEPL